MRASVAALTCAAVASSHTNIRNAGPIAATLARGQADMARPERAPIRKNGPKVDTVPAGPGRHEIQLAQGGAPGS
ncbi:MAG TPA: hypothetical protein VFB23_04900 [Candidatus Acidoferrales bacterium]|nr:hypothetical protein [Candidatus Acidoferrales bacterium]